MKKKDVVDALNIVAEREMTTGSLNWKGLFTVSPQRDYGLSRWASWVKEGFIKPYDVVWALEEGEKIKWIAVRVHISKEGFSFSKKPDKNTFYFSLRSQNDRNKLRLLENEFAVFLESLK